MILENLLQQCCNVADTLIVVVTVILNILVFGFPDLSGCTGPSIMAAFAATVSCAGDRLIPGHMSRPRRCGGNFPDPYLPQLKNTKSVNSL